MDRVLEVHDEDPIGGVLRWLLSETEAESAAFLMLGLGGVERFHVEPRGLSADDLASLAAQVHETLTDTDPIDDPESAVVRWLGIGGSKALLLRGAAEKDVADELRFARFILEWAAAVRTEAGTREVEHRARSVPGVAWAELRDGDPPQLRVLLAAAADPTETLEAVEQQAPGVRVVVERPGVETVEEPRARLIDLQMSDHGDVTADVAIDWRGHELRGRGFGRASSAGRLHASAEAVIDAMKPLVDTDLAIEGLYQTADSREGMDVLVVSIRVGSERYVGAVMAREGQEGASAARAVLDALNRRLPRIAGRSGRL